MRATVLFVDDDQRFIARYATAVELRGMTPVCRHGVDDALSYLRGGEPADIIVWDMMMVPGEEFANEDTEGGLATGLLLYRTMRELRPEATFILLTNLNPDLEEGTQPGRRLFIRFKVYTPPDVLADFATSLTGVDKKRNAGEVK